MALRDLGPAFEWALIATRNAETAFFPATAARMVAGLDPDVPYLLTGAVRNRVSRMCCNHAGVLSQGLVL